MIQCRSCGDGWEFRWGQGERLENSDDHDRNELNLDQHPQSSPGRHSIKRCRLPQESLQLLKVHCLLLGRSWRGLLKLKVNLMQLIITDNYALNHTTLGLIIYWEMIDEKKKMMDHDRQATRRREFWLKMDCYSHQALRRRWMCLNSQLSSQFLLPLLLFPFLFLFSLTKYFNVCLMRTKCNVKQ